MEGTASPFQKEFDLIAYDRKVGRILKCGVCGSVMLLADCDRMDGMELLRFRCPKNCRGSDRLQERRIPSLPKIREFDWKKEAEDQLIKYNTEFRRRTFICRVCGKKRSGKFHQRRQSCPGECEKELNRMAAHERYLKKSHPKFRRS